MVLSSTPKTIDICDQGTSKPTDQTIIEINMESTLENILMAIQDIQETLSHKILRAKQKTDAHSKIAWAIKHIKEMRILVTPSLISQQQYIKADDEISTIKTDLKEIKETLKSMATKSLLSYV